MSQIYNLKGPQPGRRAGLTRAGWAGKPSLHQIRVPKKTLQSTMAPRSAKAVAGKIKQEAPAEKGTDEDIFAAPKGSDDSDSDELPSADIPKTIFSRASEEPKPQIGGSKSRPSRILNGKNNVLNGKDANSTLNKGFPQPSGLKSSQNSSQGSKSPKRKSQQGNLVYGQGMTDAFGRVHVSSKKRKLGSSQSKYGSSQPTSSLASNNSKLSEDSPKKSFIKHDPIPESDDDDDDDSSSAMSRFKKHDIGEPPVKSSPEMLVKFRHAPVLDSPVRQHAEKLPSFNTPFDSSLDDELISIPPIRGASRVADQVDPPASQLEVFRKIDLLGGLGDELVDTARAIISAALPSRRVDSTFEDDFPTSTQLAKCPMCNQVVDPDDLRAWKGMNTRKQEKFCQSHQKKSALDEWDMRGYPEIEWENIDSRLAKHHAFIKELINGVKCHYRLKLEEAIKAGKDRNLLKTETLLTPGYYGSRGLQAISDSIMKEFTPALKKRAVTDRIMAARGVTGFVQSVLVPEVTTLLIKEDMNVNVEEAREIMVESIRIGELVHEEIRDVVMQRVEDSEDDGFDD